MGVEKALDERAKVRRRARCLSAAYKCYMSAVSDAEETPRTFKTAWFTKEARIKDDELCKAIEEVRKGQADDLGGGVFKKRLSKDMHRSIILAKGDDIGLRVPVREKGPRQHRRRGPGRLQK